MQKDEIDLKIGVFKLQKDEIGLQMGEFNLQKDEIVMQKVEFGVQKVELGVQTLYLICSLKSQTFLVILCHIHIYICIIWY